MTDKTIRKGLMKTPTKPTIDLKRVHPLPAFYYLLRCCFHWRGFEPFTPAHPRPFHRAHHGPSALFELP